MQKELIDKANEIIRLIEKNEKAIEILSEYTESGKELYTETDRYMCSFGYTFPKSIDFEGGKSG